MSVYIVFTNKNFGQLSYMSLKCRKLAKNPYLALHVKLTTVLICNINNSTMFCIYFGEVIAFLHCSQTTAPIYDIIFWRESVSHTKVLKIIEKSNLITVSLFLATNLNFVYGLYRLSNLQSTVQ